VAYPLSTPPIPIIQAPITSERRMPRPWPANPLVITKTPMNRAKTEIRIPARPKPMLKALMIGSRIGAGASQIASWTSSEAISNPSITHR
jgi:hypothetical protein